MLKLKAILEKLDELPESINPRELFVERNGRFELAGVEGIKTQADVDRVQVTLDKERTEHGKTKSDLSDKVAQLTDENEELKVKVNAKGDKIDDAALNTMVESRLAARLRPIERERDKLKTDFEGLLKENTSLKGSDARRRVLDSVREATAGEKGIKVIDTAFADVELLAERVFEINSEGKVVVRDQVGFTPGLSPREWLSDIQTSGLRKHWFPGNVGAGANGSDGANANGTNPFVGDKPNITKIGQLVKFNPQQAVRLATAAKRTDLLPPEIRPEA